MASLYQPSLWSSSRTPITTEGHLATTTVIALKGASGASYDFEVYTWGTDFKPLAAVYTVLRLRADGLYDVIYIGQTGNLSERFDDHHKAWCFNRNGKTHIGIHLESTEKNRLFIEQDLVAYYQPPCNGN